MARFVYKLQNILKLKQKMEDQAKQEFSVANMALDEALAKLDELIARKKTYEERAKKLLNGTLDVREIEINQNALLVMDGYIAEQRGKVSLAQKAVEEAREHMALAMRERKTQEILRERAFEEFLREENRAESKAIDELTSYVYGQKQEG